MLELAIGIILGQMLGAGETEAAKDSSKKGKYNGVEIVEFKNLYEVIEFVFNKKQGTK